MNIDGMPDSSRHFIGFLKAYKKKKDHSAVETEKAADSANEPEKMTRRESVGMVLNAMLAGLVVALIFGLIGFLIILFCTNIWFV